MRQPPLKAIEAVVTKRVDSRTRRIVRHFRGYFRCLDDKGHETDDPDEAAQILLTPRGQEYWDQNHGGKRRIPSTV